jgi:hypothetical protein
MGVIVVACWAQFAGCLFRSTVFLFICSLCDFVVFVLSSLSLLQQSGASLPASCYVCSYQHDPSNRTVANIFLVDRCDLLQTIEEPTALLVLKDLI